MPKPPVVVRGVALAFAIAVGTCACSAAPQAGGDDRTVVLTTFTVLQDIAQNVAGEHLAVESITKLGSEIHGYEPTPGDLRRAQNASLIIDNGMGLEAWFEQFTQDLDVPRVVASAGVEPMPIAEDAYAGQDNPHAWMSALNAQIYVDNVVAAFSQLDPDNAGAFAANGAAYKAELQSLHDRLVHELATLPRSHRALVTCEGAFSYLARDAGLTEKYIWPVNAEQQATPRQIADTIAFVAENDVPAVFCESTVSDDPMRRVVEGSGAAFGGTLYVDSLSGPDGPVPTYLDLIAYDVEVILSGLGGESP